ncbi:MAG: glycosyltransferase family 4 protein [Thermodesulfobacteriota bacterium]
MEAKGRMRVLHLSDRLSARGGADRHLLAMLGRLQGRVETLWAMGRDDRSLPSDERAGLGPWQRVKGLDRQGLRGRGGQAALGRLAALLAEFRPQVIHLHNIMDPELLALAAGAAGAVMTVQDHRLFCPGRGKLRPDGGVCGRPMGDHCLACFGDQEYGARLLALTRRRLAATRGLARLTVLSNYMAGELAAAGVAAERVRVLPPWPQGLAAEAAGPGAYHLLAGRLVGRKGVRVALAALERLERPLPLIVAGDGPLAQELAATTAAREGRLRLVGWADRARMGRLLAGAVSLWLPSLWAEPFGLVGVEALFCGTPVLAAAVGGVGEWLLEGRHGRLLPPGDAAALAQAADELAADPARAREMGRAGRQWVQRHLDPEVLTRRLLEVYQKVAGGAA